MKITGLVAILGVSAAQGESWPGMSKPVRASWYF